jgi:NitT/TauT family transport system permease protein
MSGGSARFGRLTRVLHPRQAMSRPCKATGAILGFVLFVAAWQLLSARYEEKGQAVLFPSPAAVAGAALDYLGQGPRTAKRVAEARATAATPAEADRAEMEIRAKARESLQTLKGDLKISFQRVFIAFLLAALVGVPLGLFIGAFNWFESILQPVTEFIRYVPVPALIPLLIVLFGIDESPKVMLIFIGTVLQLVLMTSDEIRRVSMDLLQVCYTLGGKASEVVFKVMLPAAMPGIFDALRLCNGWAWTWLIVAELVAANEGMGYRIVKYQRFLDTERIFVYLVILGLVGLVIDLLFRLMNRHFFRWAATDKR